MQEQYKLYLYKIRYNGKELPIYAPNDIQELFLHNNINYVRNMIYHPIDIDLREVKEYTYKIAEAIAEANKIQLK